MLGTCFLHRACFLNSTQLVFHIGNSVYIGLRGCKECTFLFPLKTSLVFGSGRALLFSCFLFQCVIRSLSGMFRHLLLSSFSHSVLKLSKVHVNTKPLYSLLLKIMWLFSTESHQENWQSPSRGCWCHWFEQRGFEGPFTKVWPECWTHCWWAVFEIQTQHEV